MLTAQQDLDAIADWWKRGGDPGSGFSRMFPIADSPHDQAVPDGMDNPYWEIIRRLPSIQDPWDGITPYSYPHGLGLYRQDFTTRYAWAIPSPGDITWMKSLLDGRGLVEIGAGAGYWAWQARQAGIDVIAYEPAAAADNIHVEVEPFTELADGDHTAAARHPDRALLVCWPTYSHPWAGEGLSLYQGDLLIYVGESWGGCCADDAFFEQLDAQWTEVESSPQHVTWWGVHCRMTAYRRADLPVA